MSGCDVLNVTDGLVCIRHHVGCNALASVSMIMHQKPTNDLTSLGQASQEVRGVKLEAGRPGRKC